MEKPQRKQVGVEIMFLFKSVCLFFLIFHRRKRGEKGEVVETVEDVIVRKLTAERVEELKKVIKETQEKYRYLSERMQNGWERQMGLTYSSQKYLNRLKNIVYPPLILQTTEKRCRTNSSWAHGQQTG